MQSHAFQHKALKSKSKAKDDLQSLPMTALLEKLGSSEKGLSQSEAKKRLLQYGPNTLASRVDNKDGIDQAVLSGLKNANVLKGYHINHFLIPWVVAIAMFMETLDGTIVGVAIPDIARSFAINPISLKLALTSYLLSLAVFIPISGWMADRFSSRKVFCWAMVIFTMSSLCCGLSTSLPWLVVMRTVQGIGGAMMMPVGRLIILQMFSKEERLRVMTFVVVPALVGPALGPTIGGLILHVLSWHWIFFVNIPFGILGILIILHYVPTLPLEHTHKLDWQGFVLFGTGLATLTLTLAIIGEAFKYWIYASLFGTVSIVLLMAYFLHSRHQEYPILNLKLFRSSAFFVSIFGNFSTRLATGAIPFLLPLLLQVAWEKSALYSGLLFISLGVGMMSGRGLFNRFFLPYFSYRAMISLNTIAISILMISISFCIPSENSVLLGILLFFQGIFTAQQFTTLARLVYANVGEQHYSQTTSIMSTVQQFAGGTGIAIAAILLHTIAKTNHISPFSSIVFQWSFILLGVMPLFILPFVGRLKERM